MNQPEAPKPAFFIDSTTPFYEVQPTAAMCEVADREMQKIRNAASAAGAKIARGPVRVGSSAIPRMPGSAMIDLALVVPEMSPPPPSLLEALKAAGYDYKVGIINLKIEYIYI